MGVPLDPCFRPPSTYREELLGVEYLYGENAQTLSLDVDKDIDEGIGEHEIFFPQLKQRTSIQSLRLRVVLL
jgi:hypothetical protein